MEIRLESYDGNSDIILGYLCYNSTKVFFGSSPSSVSIKKFTSLWNINNL